MFQGLQFGTPWRPELLPAPPDSAGIIRVATWTAGMPLFRHVYARTLPLEVAYTTAVLLMLLLLPGGTRPARPSLLLRHLDAVLLLTHVVHEFVGTPAWALAAARTTGARVIWPNFMGFIIASFTPISYIGYSVRLQLAVPLLLLRALAPVVAIAARGAAPIWLETPPVGTALQLASCALTYLVLLRQERNWRATYAAEAAAEAAGEEGGASQNERKRRRD